MFCLLCGAIPSDTIEFMDSVDHPLDWWAYGGFPAVMRDMVCSKVEARHRVRPKITKQ